MATIIDLGAQVKAKYPGQYDDLSDEEVGRKVKAKFPGSYDDFSDKTIKVAEHMRTRRQTREKPMLQSLAENQNVGGLLGPAGGMLSEGLKMSGEIPSGNHPTAEQANQAFEQNIGRLVGAGAQQLGLDIGGKSLVGGARLVGRGLMQAALRATPDVAKTAIKEGVMAVQGSMGVKRLMNSLGRAGERTMATVRRATQLGGAYHPTDLLHSTQGLVGASFPEEDVKLLQELNDRFLANHKVAITPVGLHEIKREMDQLARPIYRKIEGKQVLDTARVTEQRWAKQVADNARELLNQTVPGYSDANAKTEALIALKKVLIPAAKKGVVPRLAAASVGTTVGAGVGAATQPEDRMRAAGIGATIGALASSPAGLSTMSLIVNNPALANLLRQLPRAGAALVQE